MPIRLSFTYMNTITIFFLTRKYLILIELHVDMSIDIKPFMGNSFKVIIIHINRFYSLERVLFISR